jgi:hypothetical protein
MVSLTFFFAFSAVFFALPETSSNFDLAWSVTSAAVFDANPIVSKYQKKNFKNSIF